MGVTETSSLATRASEGRIQSSKRDSVRGLSWGAYLLIVFAVGRAVDIVPVVSSLPLVKVVLVYTAFAMMSYWSLLPKVITPDNPAVKWAIALAVWSVVSISFSIWPGPSRDFIIGQLPVLCVLVFVICKLSSDWQSLRRLFLALFVSAMILTLPGLLHYGGGRLEVQSWYDTNDLALVLDGLIPIALAFGMTAASRMRRLLFYASVALITLTVILTGSRGGLFGLLALVVFVVLEPGTLRPRQVATKFATTRKRKMGAKKRILLSLMACALIGVAVWPLLPPETRERLATVVNLGSDYNVSDEKTGRVEIWMRGLEALAHRPIGVGVQAYPMVDKGYGFHTAHNSVVLVLVELGPVGFVMYLAVLLHTWRGLTRIRRTLRRLEVPSDEQRQQAIFCRMLQASLVGNFVAGEFLSAAYFYAYWANLGLAMGLISLLNRATLEVTPERKIVFGR